MMDTTQAKMFVSSLNNSAAKILVAFILARTALDVQELREWTGLKRETLYDGLKTLQLRGMVAKQILEHGRAVWLPSGDFLPGVFQMSTKRTPELQESRIRTSDSLIVVRDSKDLIKLNTPTINNDQVSEKRTPEAEIEVSIQPSVLKILRHTDLLFDGSFVNNKDLEHCIPEEILAWCAYGYSQFQKRQCDRPAGLVRRKLLDGEHASEKMRAHWREILPEEFLEAVGGLVTYVCDVCHESFEHRADLNMHKELHPVFAICEVCSMKFETREQLDQHYKDEHPEPKRLEPDQSVKTPIAGGMNAAQAWQAVLVQLQLDMPRASFETWVQDTQALRYGRNVLTVGGANQYAADWLESRLTSTVERLLIGILNAEVSVKFIVAESAEVEA